MAQKLFTFTPVGFDAWSPARGGPQAGSLVRKVQPPMTPRNGTMGHCYVAPADGPAGDFALVLLNSLVPA